MRTVLQIQHYYLIGIGGDGPETHFRTAGKRVLGARFDGLFLVLKAGY